jgi:heat shock protein HtpX
VNLYEQQARNRRQTVLVMAVFVAVLLVVGLGFDSAVMAGGAFFPIGTAVALTYGTGSAWISYARGDRAVLASTGAVPVDRALADAPDEAGRLRLRQFQNVVDEMAIAAGLPRPAAYVVPDPDPNAFATGRDPSRASLAVTEGLLRRLDRDELQGVVAHEMSHIRNFDIRLMTIVAALVGAIALLADWAARGMRYGVFGRRGRSRDSAGAALSVVMVVAWLAAVLLAPLVARLLAMLVSRKREYLADATAAELTRNPMALASALAKIDAEAAPTTAVKRGSAHLCIADPLGRRVNARSGGLSNLFASHPPMADRIARLRTMAFEPTR